MAIPVQYGIREVCDLKFYKLGTDGGKGDLDFEMDNAKTSTIENDTNTVYAKDDKDNSRLITS